MSDYNDYNDRDHGYDGRDHQDYHGQGPVDPHGGSHAMRIASYALALAAIFSCSFIFAAIPLAALSIILALLSRGNEKKTDSVRITLICDVCAIIASAAITGYSFYTVYNSPLLKAQLDHAIRYYERLYGLESGEGDSDFFSLFGSEEDQPESSGGSGDPSEDYYKRYYEKNTDGTSDPEEDSSDNGYSFDSGGSSGEDENDGSSGENSPSFVSGGDFV